MKKNFILFAAIFLTLIQSGFSHAQVLLPTYATGAPIRPGNLMEDDRLELWEAGIVPNEDKDGNERMSGGNASPFHAGSSKAQACAASNILATPYNTNNGQRGCMFDVYAANTVTVRCFEANLYSGTTANYEIYYKVGTLVGSETNAAAWTFLGGATGVTSAGNNVPTALPIPINVTIPAGATYAFYVTNDFGGGTSYTDGAAVGNFLAGDANITVYQGVGKSYPFGLTFAVRNFNGHIYYDLEGALDAEDAHLQATSSTGGVNLDWQLGEQMQISTLALQRSEDGTRFHDLAQWNAAANPTSYLDTEPSADQLYYRLQVIDQEGKVSYSNIAEVLTETGPALALESVYPNPFSRAVQMDLQSRHEETLKVQVLNAMGQEVYRAEMAIVPGRNHLEMDMPGLAAGVYTLRLQGKESDLIQKLVRN